MTSTQEKRLRIVDPYLDHVPPEAARAKPVEVDGITFVFERGKCGVHCHGWWWYWHRLAYGLTHRVRDGIEQQVRVCPEHGEPFSVGEFLVSDTVQRILASRRKARAEEAEAAKVRRVEKAGPALLSACQEIVTLMHSRDITIKPVYPDRQPDPHLMLEAAIAEATLC